MVLFRFFAVFDMKPSTECLAIILLPTFFLFAYEYELLNNSNRFQLQDFVQW